MQLQFWQIMVGLAVLMLAGIVGALLRPRVLRCAQCSEVTDPSGLADGRCLACRLPVETPERTAVRRALEQVARERLAIARVMEALPSIPDVALSYEPDTPDADRLLRAYDQEVSGER